MQDKSQQFWEKQLEVYGTKDWINQPSIFVQEAMQYFPSGSEVLELAAGQGQDSRFLAKQGYKVISTDRSDFGLKEASRKTSLENLDIEFMKVDLTKPLPFSNEQFDVVYAHMGLHYFTKEHTRSLFEEIHRVLRQGGVFAGLFNTSNDPEITANNLEQIEDNYYYEAKTGLRKRYFTIQETQFLIKDLFSPVVLDDKGRTYKDGDLGLVRFIGKAL